MLCVQQYDFRHNCIISEGAAQVETAVGAHPHTWGGLWRFLKGSLGPMGRAWSPQTSPPPILHPWSQRRAGQPWTPRPSTWGGRSYDGSCLHWVLEGLLCLTFEKELVRNIREEEESRFLWKISKSLVQELWVCLPLSSMQLLEKSEGTAFHEKQIYLLYSQVNKASDTSVWTVRSYLLFLWWRFTLS